MIADPAGIDVVGDNIQKIRTDVVVGMTAGKGDQPRIILLLHRLHQTLAEVPPFRRVRMKFVQKRPENHTRMIDAVPDHQAGFLFDQILKFGIGHLLRGVAPAETLLPDQHSILVAEIQEARILRVVASAHKVAVEIAQILQILEHHRLRRRRSELGMRFMTVESLQVDRLAVQKDLSFPRLNRPDAEAFDNDIVLCPDFKRVQFGLFTAPETEGRNGAFQRLAVCDFRRPVVGVRIEAEADGPLLRACLGKQETQRNASGLMGERADLHTVENCPGRKLMQFDSAVESAERVEVVIGQEQFHPVARGVLHGRTVEVVVDRRGDDMHSRLQRTGFKLHSAVRQVRESDLFPVDAESCPQSDRPDLENAAGRILPQPELPPIESGSAFAAVCGRRIECAGNAHHVVRGERLFIGILQKGFFQKAELPDAVQIGDAPLRIQGIRSHSNSISMTGSVFLLRFFLFLINLLLFFLFSMI